MELLNKWTFSRSVVLLAFLPLFCKAQNYSRQTSIGDSLKVQIQWQHIPHPNAFPIKHFIFPAALVAYGAFAIHTDALQDINEEVKEEVWTESPHRHVRIDNYLQFAPAVAVYGLNIVGIHGRNNLLDRSVIYLISNIVLNATVTPLKSIAHEQRPDGSDFLSFPSGHTAEAFASAEFMRTEYKDVSPFYGVAGYAMAVATGALRIYNNKHYLSDVIAGAGIGIASTRLAYWIYPIIKKAFFKRTDARAFLMPTYQQGNIGLVFAYHL